MAHPGGRKRLVVTVAALAGVVLALTALSVRFQRTLQLVTADQFNRQQLLLAKAQAANIQHYIDGVGEKVSAVARAAARLQVRREADLELLSGILLDDAHAVKKRVEFFDRDGRRLAGRSTTGLAGPDAGDLLVRVRDLCPAGVLVEADARAVTVAAPVCDGGALSGTVVARLEIQDIASSFLGPAKPGATSYAWIMDGQGTLLFHPEQPDMAGRNLHRADASCFACHRGFDLEKKITEATGDDFGRYVAPTGEDKIVAFSTTAVGAERWIVAVSAPYSEVTKSTGKWMGVYALIVILGFLTTAGVAAGLIVAERRREQAEALARREQTLEMLHAERLGALERLTSGIVEEIGSPLDSIFCFVEVLMAREKDEFKCETLETIHLHMERIADILQQLSRFSERSSSALAASRVNNLVEGALSLIQYDRKVRNVTFVRDLAPSLPEIRTDKAALAQVIVNVVLRAADAMPAGGTLVVRSRLSEGRVVLEFEDTGAGMTREEIKRIFDPLPLEREKGRGAGLAVSLGMVRRLGGDLRVESGPGGGTKVLLTLPVEGSVSPA